jgi:hypothetical protein
MTDARRPVIPHFNSLQDEAEYWDTHDTTIHEAEWKPVKLQFARNLSQGITIRFSPEALDQLRALAHEQGLGPTTLARMWVLERLRQAKGGDSGSTASMQ